VGNTSTGVEKTASRLISSVDIKKHLHGRGEDVIQKVGAQADAETPPRAWRRLSHPEAFTRCCRNTSTGVEKTIRIG